MIPGAISRHLDVLNPIFLKLLGESNSSARLEIENVIQFLAREPDIIEEILGNFKDPSQTSLCSCSIGYSTLSFRYQRYGSYTGTWFEPSFNVKRQFPPITTFSRPGALFSGSGSTQPKRMSRSLSCFFARPTKRADLYSRLSVGRGYRRIRSVFSSSEDFFVVFMMLR